MNMPGFTAESSVFRTSEVYYSAPAAHGAGAISPSLAGQFAAAARPISRPRLCRWLLKQCRTGWDLGCDLYILLC